MRRREQETEREGGRGRDTGRICAGIRVKISERRWIPAYREEIEKSAL